ncbi:hypothetical protein ScPMuIL_014604 [Solemya velum]
MYNRLENCSSFGIKEERYVSPRESKLKNCLYTPLGYFALEGCHPIDQAFQSEMRRMQLIKHGMQPPITKKKMAAQGHLVMHSCPVFERCQSCRRAKENSMNAKQANSRLPPRRNSERELKEENSSLKEGEAKNYCENIQRLETCLKESEYEKTETMEKDMISLEATHMREREEQDRRNLFLESKAESYEKKLLLCNIDPVTLMNLDPGDGDEMQKKIEVVKHKKKLLNEKLKKMNEEYVSHIDEIKVMTDSLEKIKENLPVPVYTDARDAEDNMKHKSP